MQQVDGTQLILGDAVRTAKVIGLRPLGRVVILVAAIPEYPVDFFLRENAVHLHM